MYSEKKLYIGQVVNGKPHGVGIMEYKNGTKYFGHFVNGDRHGLGLLEFSGLNSLGFLAGSFTEDSFDGKGAMIWKNETATHVTNGGFTSEEFVSRPLATSSQGFSVSVQNSGFQLGTDFNTNGQKFGGFDDIFRQGDSYPNFRNSFG